MDLSKQDLAVLDRDYTLYLAKIIQGFLAQQPQLPDFVSSHGHTVLHQPEKGNNLSNWKFTFSFRSDRTEGYLQF